MLKIEYLEEKVPVYDITVKNQHNFFANDILVHNCVEVMQPTKPIYDMNDLENEVSLCVLSGINFGKIKNVSDLEKPCELAVRALNQLIDQQDYLLPASKNSAINRRMLGIGIVNLAYWLAKNDMSYENITDEQLTVFHQYMEAFSYYIIKASVQVAKETKACPKFSDTKYSSGIFPIDTYKKSVDEFVSDSFLKMDWDSLKKDVVEFGMANSLLMAQFPAETSAQIANATNGIEPPRALVSSKQSKDGVLSQVVPDIKKLKNKYNLLWDQKSPKGYLKICAIMQKFMDQSISTNTSYNPKFFPDEEIPMSVMLEDLLFAYKCGLKSLYYFNTFVDEAKEDSEEDCSSCKL